jgi:T-complex protein 1 subunit alpha
VNNKGEVKYPLKAVRILKAHGKSATESLLIHGYAINCQVASQGSPLQPLRKLTLAMKKSMKNTKIAWVDMNLQKTRISLHAQFNSPIQLNSRQSVQKNQKLR